MSKQNSESNGTSAQAAQEWARQTAQYLRARQVATQAQLGPYAANARTAAQQGMLGARAWTAPRLDALALALQERLTPQAAAALSAAARRIEPVPPEPHRRRWPAVAAGVVIFAGGAAAAVYVLNRRSGNGAAETAEPGETASSSETQPGVAAADTVSADANSQTQGP